MAKLNEDLQAQTAEAETSAFEPLDPGTYHATLRDVDTTRSGGKGPYWSWEFEVIDEPYVGRRLWNNTSLSKAAAFKMRETFDAFSASLDTDTDELIGKPVRVTVSVRTIQEGARKGELSNQVDRLKPADPDVVARLDEEETKKREVADLF